MLDKKVTRKDFLLSVLSITALFATSKIPQIVKRSISMTDEKNSYGNSSYGGSKKNA